MKTPFILAASAILMLGLAPSAVANHGYGPEPTASTAAVCYTDIWAGNIHVAPKCRELWTCIGMTEARSKEYEVRGTYVTVYYCAPGPATGPPI